MKVSEIFYSIQGEGINIGCPAIFLRLALCNLRCVWCDSKYTWDWDHFSRETEVKEMNVAEVENEIQKYPGKHLVMTGGEPLLQQKTIIPLLSALKGQDYYIEVETNGTILPVRQVREFIDQWNVSPKLENSGNPRPKREKGNCYRFFAREANSYFKYVIQDPLDMLEVRDLLSEYQISPSQVILMPQATTASELSARSGWLVEICKEYGFRFSPRLHIEIWGNKRGH